MKKRMLFLLVQVALRSNAFQLQHRLKPHSTLSEVNIGFFNPSDWSDLKPNHDKKGDSIAVTSESMLSPIQSAWTKYGMIAYVAHLCAFLPLSLLPTYFQTKLGK